ncbi:hypothetical protein TSAR_006858 [Trichomalopsis sarcophagae]|uniref:Uncharacterized protein n=1 Tax=Trichomalopsis sarcophagae TaxID=543379 RepID=A0A232EFI7_9HYME|nr:hypothetical protein TSAR_006858 [Trichomalopsis sarcophagae]
MKEAAKEKIEKTITLIMLKGRRRRRYLDSGKEDYGEVQQHLEKLRKDQTHRVEIERTTVNQSECDLWYQNRSQLHVNRRDYCIFALCTKIDIKYIRVGRDDDFWKNKIPDRKKRRKEKNYQTGSDVS